MQMLHFLTNQDTPAAPAGFPDHLDPQIVLYLPNGLVIARTDDGTPDFMLLTYRASGALAGGMLSMRLTTRAPAAELVAAEAAAGRQARPVAFDAGFFRLRLRSLLGDANDQLGDWRPAIFTGGRLTIDVVSLSQIELELLRTLLDDGRSVIEIDLDLRYRGLIDGVPLIASAPTGALKAALAPHLSGPSSADEIAAAFQSLPGELLGWRAMAADAPPASPALLREVALRALPLLFDEQPGAAPIDPPRYQLRAATPADPPTFAVDLLPGRVEQRSHMLAWSVTELWQTVTDPNQRRKLFPVAGGQDLFSSVNICIVNHLPYDPAYLRETRAELRFVNAKGVPEYYTYVFDGTTDLVQLGAAYQSLTGSFKLDYRLSAVLAGAPGGWPTLIKRDFASAATPVIDISQAAIGIDIVRVEAEPAVFAKAAAIDVALLPAGASAPLVQLTLTAARPTAWVALPNGGPTAALYARCVAHPPSGINAPSIGLADAPVVDRAMFIAAYQLEPLGPDRISIALDPAAAEQVAFATIELVRDPAPTASGRRLPLEPGRPQSWFCQRASLFEPISFRYRLSYALFDQAGGALPIVTTDWVVGSGNTLVVSPPIGETAVRP